MFGAEVLLQLASRICCTSHLHPHPTRYSTTGRWLHLTWRFPSAQAQVDMASSIYFGRGNGYIEKSHLGNGLPTYSSSSAAVREKRHRQQYSTSWLTPVSLPIPGVRTRRLRLMTPNIARLHQASVARFGRRRGPFMLLLGFLATLYFIFAIHRRFGSGDRSWPTPISLGEPSTLVYRREDLQRIWEWEVAAGHYPSARRSTCLSSSDALFSKLLCSSGTGWAPKSSP